MLVAGERPSEHGESKQAQVRSMAADLSLSYGKHLRLSRVPAGWRFLCGYCCSVWIAAFLSFQYLRNLAVTSPDGLAPAACSSMELPK